MSCLLMWRIKEWQVCRASWDLISTKSEMVRNFFYAELVDWNVFFFYCHLSEIIKWSCVLDRWFGTNRKSQVVMSWFRVSCFGYCLVTFCFILKPCSSMCQLACSSLVCFQPCLISLPCSDCVHLFPVTLCIDSPLLSLSCASLSR